ncbi:MAG TPA: hypothetical protein VMT76_01460 [Puia sp.]|nr:hypothetical protein [Puia sp.]
MKQWILTALILLSTATFVQAASKHQQRQTKSKALKEVKCPKHPRPKHH